MEEEVVCDKRVYRWVFSKREGGIGRRKHGAEHLY
jgi:hypothetical protein